MDTIELQTRRDKLAKWEDEYSFGALRVMLAGAEKDLAISRILDRYYSASDDSPAQEQAVDEYTELTGVQWILRCPAHRR